MLKNVEAKTYRLGFLYVVIRVRVIMSNFDFNGKEAATLYRARSGLLRPSIPLGGIYTPDGKHALWAL